MKNKRIIGILLAILLVVLVAILLFCKKGSIKASVLRDYEGDKEQSIEELVKEYEREMMRELEVMEKDLTALEKNRELDAEQLADLQGKYDSFSHDVKLLLKEMRIEVAGLENQKLDKADLEAYQEAMANQIAGMKNDLASVELGERENKKNNEKLVKSLEEMQKELTAFKENYEKNNAQIEEDIKKMQSEIGSRKETIFENYENGIWKALEEYDKALHEFENGNQKMHKDMQQAISSNQMTLEEMKKASESNMNTVHKRLDELDENVAKKLDITTFETYKDGVNMSVNDMLKEIDELKKALSQEVNDRTESDEEINQRIDELTASWNSFQVNGTMTLAQIESSLAALQQVIGNEDISDYANGTISGAIADLWMQCGDCRIYYDEVTAHFYAEYMVGEQHVLRQLDYVNE